MSGWSQCVKASKGKTFSSIEIKVGIPQGGPLSAKMFTYVTDEISGDLLGTKANVSDLCKYSDDTRLLHNIRKHNADEDHELYQTMANKIAEISHKKNPKLNVNKCNEIIFMQGQSKSANVRKAADKILTMNGMDVPKVKKVKYLGVHINEDHKWNDQVNSIVKKVNFISKSLTLFMPYVNSKIKLQMFKSYILPNIMYSVEVWGAAITEKEIRKLRKSLKYFAACSQLDLTSLINICNESYEKKIDQRIEKILMNANHPLHTKLQSLKQSQYKTRNSCRVLYCRTTSYQKSFVPIASLRQSEVCQLPFS